MPFVTCTEESGCDNCAWLIGVSHSLLFAQITLSSAQFPCSSKWWELLAFIIAQDPPSFTKRTLCLEKYLRITEKHFMIMTLFFYFFMTYIL